MDPVEHRILYPSGNLHEIYTTVGDVKHGKYCSYRDCEIQILITMCYYINGKLEGMHVTYSGYRFEQYEYKNDVRHGEYRLCYHEHGVIKVLAKCNYLNDRIEGAFITYYGNGKIREISNYLHGLLHGKTAEYNYENTMQTRELNYAFGILHGKHLEWNIQKNRLIYYAEYYNDELHGIACDYYNNGSPEWERTYVNGKKEGESKSWYPNGQLREHCFYHEDKLVNTYKQWESNGKLSIECSHDDNCQLIHNLHCIYEKDRFARRHDNGIVLTGEELKKVNERMDSMFWF